MDEGEEGEDKGDGEILDALTSPPLANENDVVMTTAATATPLNVAITPIRAPRDFPCHQFDNAATTLML